MTRRKVLVIPSWYPSSDSPLNGVFIHEQARALARRFEVAVLTPRFPSLSELATLRWGPRLIREDDHGIDTWKIRHLKIPTLRRWIPGNFFPDHALVYYRKYAAAIRRVFAQYVAECGLPDLIHAHVVLPGGWIGVELAEQFGVPIVLTEHSGPFSMHLPNARQANLARSILERADRVCAVSASLRADMNALCPEVQIDVIGNLIDTDFFNPAKRPTRSDAPFRFFFLGFLREPKGVQYLLQAAHGLRAAGYRNFEVRIGGDGPHRPALTRMVRDLKLEPQCQFLGLLNREQARTQMQACDVFVLPSLGETFGVVLGEAMACGKPVLSTRCGGPEEVVTPETGILVSPADVPALADAMAAFLDGRHAFEPQRIRASVVERFGPASFVKKTEQLYAETIRRSPAPARLAG